MTVLRPDQLISAAQMLTKAEGRLAKAEEEVRHIRGELPAEIRCRNGINEGLRSAESALSVLSADIEELRRVSVGIVRSYQETDEEVARLARAFSDQVSEKPRKTGTAGTETNRRAFHESAADRDVNR